jgi:hypothetical protein
MLYCCTIDVVERALPTTKVKYPLVRQRLLELMESDQADRNKPWNINPDMTESEWSMLMEPDWARAREMLLLLEQVRVPSARNIGLDGSRAIWIIALHNIDYMGAGEKVLKKMQYLFYKDKTQVFYPGIPYLVDRLAMSRNNWEEGSKQTYGTQGYVDNNGIRRRYPISQPSKLTERRLRYSLNTTEEECEHSHERTT